MTSDGNVAGPPRMARTAMILLCLCLPGSSAPGGQESPFPLLSGWTVTVDTTVYTPRNLWDFIDGAAEVFLSYGFVSLTIGDYVAKDSVDVRVEAYRHESPTMAFGIYSAERKPDYHFVGIGTEGYLAEGVLNFLAGEYYVKLSTHSPGERAAAALRAVAERVAVRLNRPREWPAGLRHLPESGRRPHTEAFVAGDFLGYSFLEHAFTAQYGEGDGFLLFVIDLESGPAGEEILRKYEAVAGRPEVRNGGLRFADPNNGPVTLYRKNALLYGLVDSPGDAVEEKYISILRTRTE